jgi:hypothetical protein
MLGSCITHFLEVKLSLCVLSCTAVCLEQLQVGLDHLLWGHRHSDVSEAAVGLARDQYCLACLPVAQVRCLWVKHVQSFHALGKQAGKYNISVCAAAAAVAQ